MTEQTGLPLEQARNIIKNIQKDTIETIEKTLEEFRKKLEGSF